MAVFMAVLRAGRYGARHVARARRPPHARHEGQLQRQALQRARLRRAQRHRADRLTTRCGALAREHKPKLIIAGASAYPRTMDYAPFREIADEIGAVLMVDMAHIAGLVAVGLASVARAAGRFRHVDDAQDAARSARRVHPHDEAHARRDRQERLPGHPRRPADAHDRRQSGRVPRSAAAGVQRRISSKCSINAKAMGEELQRAGVRLVAGGTDTHLLLVDLSPKNLTGKAVEALPRRDRASP